MFNEVVLASPLSVQACSAISVSAATSTGAAARPFVVSWSMGSSTHYQLAQELEESSLQKDQKKGPMEVHEVPYAQLSTGLKKKSSGVCAVDAYILQYICGCAPAFLMCILMIDVQDCSFNNRFPHDFCGTFSSKSQAILASATGPTLPISQLELFTAVENVKKRMGSSFYSTSFQLPEAKKIQKYPKVASVKSGWESVLESAFSWDKRRTNLAEA